MAAVSCRGDSRLPWPTTWLGLHIIFRAHRIAGSPGMRCTAAIDPPVDRSVRSRSIAVGLPVFGHATRVSTSSPDPLENCPRRFVSRVFDDTVAHCDHLGTQTIARCVIEFEVEATIQTRECVRVPLKFTRLLCDRSSNGAKRLFRFAVTGDGFRWNLKNSPILAAFIFFYIEWNFLPK